MSENKKYFLDFNGLQSLWDKMKSTFATNADLLSLTGQIGTINTNLSLLENNINSVETLALSYSPKVASNYSAALIYANTAPAGTIIVVGNNETIDGVLYSEGFYIVDNNKTIKYIGTSTNTSNPEDITILLNRITALENDIIRTASIVDSNGNQLGGYTIANNTLLMTYDDTVVANSESVNALTHRAIAAKFGELEAKLTSIPKFKISVVDELPVNEISHSTIYLVKSSDISQNMYTEYIYIQNIGWEKLGEQSIVLDDYVTKEFLTNTLNSALSNYATIQNVNTAIENSKAELLGIIDSTYLKKTDANFATEESILNSIQTGLIGNTIMITEEQINALK